MTSKCTLVLKFLSNRLSCTMSSDGKERNARRFVAAVRLRQRSQPTGSERVSACVNSPRQSYREHGWLPSEGMLSPISVNRSHRELLGQR